MSSDIAVENLKDDIIKRGHLEIEADPDDLQGVLAEVQDLLYRYDGLAPATRQAIIDLYEFDDERFRVDVRAGRRSLGVMLSNGEVRLKPDAYEKAFELWMELRSLFERISPTGFRFGIGDDLTYGWWPEDELWFERLAVKEVMPCT